MSCKHGNWAPCEECDELDALTDQIYEMKEEIQNHEKAYELLFKENARLRAVILSQGEQGHD